MLEVTVCVRCHVSIEDRTFGTSRDVLLGIVPGAEVGCMSHL